MLDRQIWNECRHEPVNMLKKLQSVFLKTVAGDLDYLRHSDDVVAKSRKTMGSIGSWFPKNITNPECLPIAYFPAEHYIIACTVMQTDWALWPVTISKNAATPEWH